MMKCFSLFLRFSGSFGKGKKIPLLTRLFENVAKSWRKEERLIF